MMKNFIILIILIHLGLCSYSQYQVGIDAGYNWTTTHEYNSDHVSLITFAHNSYIISIFCNQRTQRLFNLGLHFEYAQRDYSIKSHWGGVGGGYSNSRVTSNYLNFQIQGQTVTRGKVKFFFYPGLYFGALLKSTVYIEYPKNLQWKIPGYEFGILAGLGLDIPIYKGLCINIVNEYSISLLPKYYAVSGQSNLRFFQLKLEAGIAYTFRKHQSNQNGNK
jgi:hypothetical protein